MRYVVRQKILALAASFSIANQYGDVLYDCQGRIFTLGNRLSFQDPQGQELIEIKQEWWRLAPTYHLYRGGKFLASVQRKLFTFLRPTFMVRTEGGDELTIRGNLIEYEYRFLRADEEIAQVSKRFFAWTDTYGVDINADEDHLLILACVVVLDLISHNHTSSSATT